MDQGLLKLIVETTPYNVETNSTNIEVKITNVDIEKRTYENTITFFIY